MAAGLLALLTDLEHARANIMYALLSNHHDPRTVAEHLTEALSDLWGAEGTCRVLGGKLGAPNETTIGMASAIGAELAAHGTA